MAETIPQFQKFLEEMSRELGWTMQYTALYTANWMCRDSMWYTPPFVNGSFEGTTKDAERAGQGALLRDINKLFMPIDARAKRTGAAVILNKLAISAKLGKMSDYFDAQEMAKSLNFDSYIIKSIVNDADQRRGFEKARNYFNSYSMQEVKENTKGVNKSEMYQIHEKHKIRRGGRMRVAPPMNYLGKFMVQNKGTMNQYIKERFKQIGKIKSGWFKVMMSLPKPKAKGRQTNIVDPTKIAEYIKRHSGSAGYQRFQTAEKGHLVNLVIGNAMGDVDAVSTRTRVQDKVEDMADKRLGDELNRQVQSFCDKANRS